MTHLAITDHDRIDGALRARDAAPDDLRIIVGQEVRTTAGDLLALYIEKPIRPGMAPAEAAQEVRAQGGAVGLAHPFDRFRAGAGRRGWEQELERVTPLLDFVEAWNARLFIGDGNTRAAQFAHEHGLPGTASSDAHTLMEVGVACTILNGPMDTAEEFRASLGGVRLVVARGSRLVRLGMPIAKLVQRMRGNRKMSVA